MERPPKKVLRTENQNLFQPHKKQVDVAQNVYNREIVQLWDYSSKFYLKPKGLLRNWYFPAVSQSEL